MTGIHLYAEVLVNIRTVTLVADLHSVNSAASTAELSANGESLTLRHEGEQATIRLPARIPGQGSAALELPASPTKKISLRLEADGDISKLLTIMEDSENVVPWMAEHMTRASELVCQSCNEILIACGRIPLWKDLPSENWAEMMDFWHCHKPDVPPHSETSNDDATAQKGYAASNRLTARPGEGLVDHLSFLFSDQDIQNIKVVPSNDDSVSSNVLQCRHCESFIGVSDDAAQGRRLLKSNVALVPAPGASHMTFPTEQWLTAQLLSAIDSQAARRFLVRDGYGCKAILLWVFTPDIWFCSSRSSTSQYEHPTRGMKVFWRPVEEVELPTIENAAAIEEIRLPETVRQILHENLQKNQILLPSEARRFQEWHVSILRRFSRLDIG